MEKDQSDAITNFDWLNNLVRINKQDWHHDRVIEPYHIDNYMFYKFEKSYEARIDPSKIKGIIYAYSYNCGGRNITWVDLLNELKRFQSIRHYNRSKDDLLGHIHKEYTEEKFVGKYGDVYITTGGQHRLCLAKFLEVPSVKVWVQEYTIDISLYNKYLQRASFLKKLKEYGLIDAEQEKKEVHQFKNSYFMLFIGGEYVSFNNDVAWLFLKAYESINIDSAWLRIYDSFIERIFGNDYGRIRMETPACVSAYIRHFRLLKRKINRMGNAPGN